jgi:hypothetical protein
MATTRGNESSDSASIAIVASAKYTESTIAGRFLHDVRLVRPYPWCIRSLGTFYMRNPRNPGKWPECLDGGTHFLPQTTTFLVKFDHHQREAAWHPRIFHASHVILPGVGCIVEA